METVVLPAVDMHVLPLYRGRSKVQSFEYLAEVERFGQLFTSQTFTHIKDPCVVPIFSSDGEKETMQMYMTAFGPGKLTVAYTAASTVYGPWQEPTPVDLRIKGTCAAAPGVIYDTVNDVNRVFAQETFNEPGGKIVQRILKNGAEVIDGGVVLESVPDSDEAGIYDAHPAVVHGKKYLTTSGFSVSYSKRISPDIFLAEFSGNSWDGNLIRKGKILSHNDVPFHNQLDHPDYEWGLEGAQLLELNDGRVALLGVAFLPYGKRGRRQRVFIATANSVFGPYKPQLALNPSLDVGWGSGENGHASAIVKDNNIVVFYQAKEPGPEHASPWGVGLAVIPQKSLAA